MCIFILASKISNALLSLYRGVRFTFCFIDRSIDSSINLLRFIYRSFDRLSITRRSINRFLKKASVFFMNHLGGAVGNLADPVYSVHRSSPPRSAASSGQSRQLRITKNSRLLFRFAAQKNPILCVHSLLPQSYFPQYAFKYLVFGHNFTNYRSTRKDQSLLHG